MRADVVGRAMRLIADGVVDREGVRGLASRLGYSERHLHRQLAAEVGAGPIALARAQRAQTARILIETTDLPFAQVAFGAGFASIRQFNDTVREVFAATPTELRSKARARDGRAPGVARRAGRDHLAAPRRPPALRRRRPPRVPRAAGRARSRGGRRQHVPPHALAAPRPGGGRAHPHPGPRPLLPADAGPPRPGQCRAAGPPAAGPRRRPGRRRRPARPGRAARATRGQGARPALARPRRRRRARGAGPSSASRCRLRAARTHTARLVASCRARPERSGRHAHPPLPHRRRRSPRSTRPGLAMPGAPQAHDPAHAGRRSWPTAEVTIDPEPIVATSSASSSPCPGLGPWTATYIAMRGLGDPDVFLAGDLGHPARAGSARGARRPVERVGRAQAWRPWRSYALHHLWASLS